jgi:hypothetical protein
VNETRPVPALAPGNNRVAPLALASNATGTQAVSRRFRRAAWVAFLAVAAGCGRDPGPAPEAPAYTDPGFVEGGGWRMHYALTASQDLPSAIAGSYGIVQRPDRAVLVIALEATGPEARAPLPAPSAEAESVGLTGEREALALARRDEGGRPTWVATVAVRRRVPVTIEIRVRATPESPSLRARLTREFRFE